jgi:hypothetical protein
MSISRQRAAASENASAARAPLDRALFIKDTCEMDSLAQDASEVFILGAGSVAGQPAFVDRTLSLSSLSCYWTYSHVPVTVSSSRSTRVRFSLESRHDYQATHGTADRERDG